MLVRTKSHHCVSTLSREKSGVFNSFKAIGMRRASCADSGIYLNAQFRVIRVDEFSFWDGSSAPLKSLQRCGLGEVVDST